MRVFTDVLREQPGGRLGVHGHGVPVRREEQQGDHRRDGQRAAGRLSRVGAGRAAHHLADAVGPVGRQGHRDRDHHPGDARVAGRRVRARRAPQLGVGPRHGPAGAERDGRHAVHGHRPAADHRGPREKFQGERARRVNRTPPRLGRPGSSPALVDGTTPSPASRKPKAGAPDRDRSTRVNQYCPKCNSVAPCDESDSFVSITLGPGLASVLSPARPV